MNGVPTKVGHPIEAGAPIEVEIRAEPQLVGRNAGVLSNMGDRPNSSTISRQSGSGMDGGRDQTRIIVNCLVEIPSNANGPFVARRAIASQSVNGFHRENMN
jgi:hypothetical protein